MFAMVFWQEYPLCLMFIPTIPPSLQVPLRLLMVKNPPVPLSSLHPIPNLFQLQSHDLNHCITLLRLGICPKPTSQTCDPQHTEFSCFLCHGGGSKGKLVCTHKCNICAGQHPLMHKQQTQSPAVLAT